MTAPRQAQSHTRAHRWPGTPPGLPPVSPGRGLQHVTAIQRALRSLRGEVDLQRAINQWVPGLLRQAHGDNIRAMCYAQTTNADCRVAIACLTGCNLSPFVAIALVSGVRSKLVDNLAMQRLALTPLYPATNQYLPLAPQAGYAVHDKAESPQHCSEVPSRKNHLCKPSVFCYTRPR